MLNRRDRDNTDSDTLKLITYSKLFEARPIRYWESAYSSHYNKRHEMRQKEMRDRNVMHRRNS